jgi:hypothetical protein
VELGNPGRLQQRVGMRESDEQSCEETYATVIYDINNKICQPQSDVYQRPSSRILAISDVKKLYFAKERGAEFGPRIRWWSNDWPRRAAGFHNNSGGGTTIYQTLEIVHDPPVPVPIVTALTPSFQNSAHSPQPSTQWQQPASLHHSYSISNASP